jgi:hypothetical protein
MSNPKSFPFQRPASQTPPALALRAEQLRMMLRPVSATLLAARTGSAYTEFGQGRGEFRLSLFDTPLVGAYPNLTFYSAAGDELPNFQQALLLYYFFTADAAPQTGNYVSFADLPAGRIYAQAFQGYSGAELVKAFGENLDLFKKICHKLGGQPLQVGSAAFSFQALPQVPLQVVYWLGDEDFPSSCAVLFDASATHYLPIDGCAILGSQLTGKIIKNLR